MIKSFKELRQIDVSKYVKQRDGVDYIPYTALVDLLHEHGADRVFYSTVQNENGSSLFMSDQSFTDKSGKVNRCYEVRIAVEVDDDKFIYSYPLTNGINPVKDDYLNQNVLYKAASRAFAKAIALRYGLGFSLWAKDDIEDAQDSEDLSKHHLYAIKERFMQEYTRLIKKGMSTTQIAEALGMTTDEVKLHFSFFDSLDRFEKKMQKL